MTVYLIGNQTKKLQLKNSVSKLQLNLSSNATSSQKKTVLEFEDKANKSKILAYNFRLLSKKYIEMKV